MFDCYLCNAEQSQRNSWTPTKSAWAFDLNTFRATSPRICFRSLLSEKSIPTSYVYPWLCSEELRSGS
jgi:hypothetical protein